MLNLTERAREFSSWVIPFEIPFELKLFALFDRVFNLVFVTAIYVVNLTVVTVVLLSRELHKPRHLFWAAFSATILIGVTYWLIIQQSNIAMSLKSKNAF